MPAAPQLQCMARVCNGRAIDACSGGMHASRDGMCIEDEHRGDEHRELGSMHQGEHRGHVYACPPQLGTRRSHQEGELALEGRHEASLVSQSEPR